MRHGILSLRLPGYLLDAIEQKRRNVSRKAGVDIKKSVLVRGILERDLIPRKRKPRVQQKVA